jgi:hypothetical protein
MTYTVAFSKYSDANISPESGAFEFTVSNTDESHDRTAEGAGTSDGQIVLFNAIVSNFAAVIRCFNKVRV